MRTLKRKKDPVDLLIKVQEARKQRAIKMDNLLAWTPKYRSELKELGLITNE